MSGIIRKVRSGNAEKAPVIGLPKEVCQTLGVGLGDYTSFRIKGKKVTLKKVQGS